MKTSYLFAAALFVAPAYSQTCVGGPDALEDNDDCATAVAIPGGMATGLNAEDGDPDFYTVTVPDGEVVTIDLTFIDVDGDLDVYLWDPAVGCDSSILGQGGAGAPLALGFSATDNETASYGNATGAAQNLVIEVRTYEPPGGPVGQCNDYDIALTFAPDPCAMLMPDSFEANDDCATAPVISDGTYTGLNRTATNPDFYQVTVADGDTLDVEILFTDATADLDLYLWDPTIACDSAIAGNGSTDALAIGFSVSDNENVSYTNITGASQVVVIEVDWFSSGSSDCIEYDMTVLGSSSGPPTIGSSFCAANNNSTGVPGLLTATGSLMVANNDVTLNVAQIPPSQFGIFVVAAAAGSMTPVNSGILCLSGQIGRYDQAGFIWQADANGDASRVIDLQMIPTPTAFVGTAPGDTWFFQAWHRDIPSGNSNFTTGVEITFI